MSAREPDLRSEELRQPEDRTSVFQIFIPPKDSPLARSYLSNLGDLFGRLGSASSSGKTTDKESKKMASLEWPPSNIHHAQAAAIKGVSISQHAEDCIQHLLQALKEHNVAVSSVVVSSKDPEVRATLARLYVCDK